MASLHGGHFVYVCLACPAKFQAAHELSDHFVNSAKSAPCAEYSDRNLLQIELSYKQKSTNAENASTIYSDHQQADDLAILDAQLDLKDDEYKSDATAEIFGWPPALANPTSAQRLVTARAMFKFVHPQCCIPEPGQEIPKSPQDGEKDEDEEKNRDNETSRGRRPKDKARLRICLLDSNARDFQLRELQELEQRLSGCGQDR